MSDSIESGVWGDSSHASRSLDTQAAFADTTLDGWDMLAIRQSTKFGGLGCWAAQPIQHTTQWKGTLEAVQHVHQPDQAFPVWPSTVVSAGSLGRVFQHLNHSCNPNCRLIVDDDGGSFTVDAIQHIQTGSELTIDYSLAGMFPLAFHCVCGMAAC